MSLIGRVGGDPEIKRFEPNLTLCNLTLAVDRSFPEDFLQSRSPSAVDASHCNAIALVGRVGNDPKDDYKVFETGSVKCRLNLAVRRWTPREGEQTDWFNIDVWGSLAESVVDRIRKGNLIWVQGAFKIDFWVDRKTSANRYAPTIVANQVELAEGKRRDLGEIDAHGGLESDQPDWFNLELWGKQAEVAERFVKKGSLIGVKGSLKIDTWNGESGDMRSKPVIRVNQLELLGSKRESSAPAVINPYQ